MIKRLELDGVVLHDITDPARAIQIARTNIDGLAEPIYRVSASDKSGEDGGTVSSVLLGMRPITLPGNVSGTDPANFIVNRRTIQQACVTRRDTDSRPIAKRMFVTTLDNVQYFADVHVQALRIGVEYNTQADWLIQVLAPDATLYVNDPQSLGPIARPVDGGSPFPWVFNPTIEFSPTTGGSLAFTNYGNAATYPIIRFRGPSTSPTLVNQTLGKLMALNTSLAPGDVVEVDMKERTIVLNGTTNYLPFKTAESDWFSIQPGDNLFSYSTASSSDTGTFELSYYPGMLGL